MVFIPTRNKFIGYKSQLLTMKSIISKKISALKYFKSWLTIL